MRTTSTGSTSLERPGINAPQPPRQYPRDAGKSIRPGLTFYIARLMKVMKRPSARPQPEDSSVQAEVYTRVEGPASRAFSHGARLRLRTGHYSLPRNVGDGARNEANGPYMEELAFWPSDRVGTLGQLRPKALMPPLRVPDLNRRRVAFQYGKDL